MTLTLSHKAHIAGGYSTEAMFNDLDEIYGGLIPQQDLGTETYEWVCSYAGGNFYASQTPDEDGQSTITITISDSTTPQSKTIVETNTCKCNTCSCKRKVTPSQDI